VDFKQFDPKYPHGAYKPFVDAIKLDLAAGLDVANHNLSGDMTGVNYSSARIAELQERDTWRAVQGWMINHFMQHIADRWLNLSLLAGAITMENGSALPAAKVDKFLAGIKFVPRGWDWVDPKNEIGAAVEAIGEGLTTRTKVVASKGGDFEENIIELAMEEELIRQHKVKIGTQTQQQAAPAPDNTQGEPNAS
jgi:lambda family phage portal protein